MDYFKLQIMAIIAALFVIAAILSVHIGHKRYLASLPHSVFKLELNDKGRVKK